MRAWTCAVALALFSAGAAAQTEVVARSDAQSLACLVKPAKAPTFPERHKLDRAYGGMRLLLKFTRPDAEPEVEVLFNSAREDMQDEVFRHVRGYRLPCLTAADGTVTAVQEFSFSNTDRDAAPLHAARSRGESGMPFCLVMPRRDMEGYNGLWVRNPEHVIAVATFAGDGEQPPAVSFIYTSGDAKFEAMVRERMAEYRMPCRKAGAAAQSMRQQFSMFPVDKKRYVWKNETINLVNFLGLTREPRKISAYYDFNTMGCPFKVRYGVYGGSVPNEAFVDGKTDPNKLPFLTWLASLQIAFKDQRQATDFFGSDLQIHVPCGVLDLKGEG